VSAYAMPVGGLPLVRVGRRETAAPARRARVLSRRGLTGEGTATHVDGEGHSALEPATPHAQGQTPAHTPAGHSTDHPLDAQAVPAEAVADPAAAQAAPGAAAAWTPPSWDEIVREHSARVYRLAYRLTGNQHDAEDLTQEVFVRVFRSLSSYTPGTFEGWLHRITTNLFLDQARRKQRIRFDGLPDDAGDRLPGRDPGPERAWEHNNLDRDVQAALDALPPDFRAAVVLCDVEGLSYEEIAEIMGAKLGTVRSRIHRGRTMLRKALAHREPTAGRQRYSGPTASSVPTHRGAVS
jgi:RNA polymerase sigma-70 factor (ECF subfamily)